MADITELILRVKFFQEANEQGLRFVKQAAMQMESVKCDLHILEKDLEKMKTEIIQG